MLGYVLRRLLGAVPTLFLVVTGAFFLMRVAPGGPFGTQRNALLSDFPITRSTLWTAALLSGDAKANDLTCVFRRKLDTDST